jgi:hypothetical protein
MVRSKLVALMCSTALFGGAVAAPAAVAKQKADGLVNVQIGDITIEDVNIALAVQLAANACDLVDVENVAVLAEETDQTSRSSTVCKTEDGKVKFLQN